VDFVTSSYHTACHFVRAGAAGHFWGVKVLMKVNDPHESLPFRLNSAFSFDREYFDTNR